MADGDKHEQWVEGVGACVDQAGAPVHRHVFDRVATLLNLEDVVWVDGDVKDENGGVDGRILIFTKDLLAIVDIAGEARPHQDEQVTGRPKGSTSVRVIPRRSLNQVSQPGADEEDPRRNTPYLWARYVHGGRPHQDGWPRYDAPVELMYPGEVVTVNGRIGATLKDFGEFMSSVMVDLTE